MSSSVARADRILSLIDALLAELDATSAPAASVRGPSKRGSDRRRHR
jgi:hypothetical protein